MDDSYEEYSDELDYEEFVNEKSYEDCLDELLDDFEKVIKALKLKDHVETEAVLDKLVSSIDDFDIKHRFRYDFIGVSPRLEIQFKKALDGYLGLADDLFGLSPIGILKDKLDDRLEEARALLETSTPESALKSKSIIDGALKSYNDELKDFKEGKHIDQTGVRLFWKLWPVMDIFIRYQHPQNYPDMANKLYGIIAEGLRSEKAIKCLKKLFDDVLPFPDDKDW